MDLLKVVVVASPFANMSALYEIDPEADVLLIVPPHSRPIAPWDDDSNPQANGLGINPPQKSKAAPPPSPGLRIKVSSKHLTLASRVFKSKLAASPGTQSDGRVHLTFGDGLFDPKAVTAVLNAVHARGRKVPRAVDLETLANITLVVDKFGLLDAIDVYADRWVDALLDSLPAAHPRDLTLWVYISHVFRRADVFKTATKLVAAHATGPIRDLGLPLREKLIKHLDAQRQDLVGQAVAAVHGTLDELTGGSAACAAYHCDALLLGELVKTLHAARLVWPPPAKPFTGVSFAGVVEAVTAGVNAAQRHAPAAAEAWGPSKPATPPGATASRKRKSPAQLPPLTPDSDPEDRVNGNEAGGGTAFETHDCAALNLAERLKRFDLLEQSVAGLELESSLGYQLY
ncbi:hypothetical protein B0T24DRAFT_564082 [Lasiosphaeria ovina]|uniref:BTB domain-containing protein n=1 Tax=Lasiosphaeria ovina TaxID=92902 RepID=A0AAE0NIG4_9PEZI|nr:hypothetical protein B0T24DRAFT_564082 [Lasiosphaeria ovina]